jgi:hypothetical protein
MIDEANQATAAHRLRCWQEFKEAAESGAAGDFALAQVLVERSPVVAGELRAYIRWIKAGRPRKAKKAHFDRPADPSQESLGHV